MIRRGESWTEWAGILLLLAGVVTFVTIVIGLAVALCHGGPPFRTLPNPIPERTDP
jgi:hypothetical protein